MISVSFEGKKGEFFAEKHNGFFFKEIDLRNFSAKKRGR